MMARRNITDRAHRYRANQLMPAGPKVCALCGSRRNLVPDHKDGHPDHTTPGNLQWLCKACNTKKGADFARAGRGRLTKQYNPAQGVPTFEQYLWAVSNHSRGAHDEGGIIIHATPDRVRSEYARRIAGLKRERGTDSRGDSDMPDWARNPSVGGVQFSLGNDGVVVWSSNWDQLYQWAEKKQHGFRYRAGGPETMGHTDVVFRGNPAKFDRCVKEVKAKGGAANAYAVCTAAGTRDNPSDWEAGNRVHGFSPEAKARALKEHVEWVERIERNGRKLSKQELQILKQRFRAAANVRRNIQMGYQDKHGFHPIRASKDYEPARGKDAAASFASAGRKLKGRRNPADVQRLVKTVRSKQRLLDRLKKQELDLEARYYALIDKDQPAAMKVKAEIDAIQDRAGEAAEQWAAASLALDDATRRNPAGAAAEVYEEFHGFEPSEVVTVTKQIQYHKHLAAAGDLVSLDVWGIDDRGHKIKGFGGSILAFNEKKNQLFVEGGDQSIDLSGFGISKPHELETLGRLTDIAYFTNKTHLGDEGGKATYVHKFRSTNDGGRHVIVRIARYPDLIYDVPNQQLLFSGGSYEILREGIDK